MRFGLYGLHRGPTVDPAVLARRARLVEDAGFESLWVGDHVAMPAGSDRIAGLAGDGRVEALTALTFMAAVTSRVLLGAGVIVVPQREPLLLAKQLAGIDRLSNGRLIFGIGVGWLEAEMRAMGADFEQRGPVTDEYLDVILALWSGEPVEFTGRFVTVRGLEELPAPARRPHPPIVVGGQSRPAFRRAVTRGNGWYGFNLDQERTRAALDRLRRAADRHERPAALGELEITVAVPGTIDAAGVAAYAALGVHRLVLLPPDTADPAFERWLEGCAPLIGSGAM
jgi:probable F420-dependent oxidoreductase